MKLARICSSVFAILGGVLMLGAIVVCLFSLDAPAEMVGMPKEAMASAEEMMQALSLGDFDAASDLVYGQPDLGAGQPPEDGLEAMVWNAFVDSISYEFVGVCYAEGTGIYRDVSVTALDIPSVTENLQTRARVLLNARMDESEDSQTDLSAAVVDQVLREALEKAIQEDAQLVTRDVTLKLIHRDGRWWVVPDQALLEILSGGVA